MLASWRVPMIFALVSGFVSLEIVACRLERILKQEVDP